jgi:hypothetical protein
MLVNLLGLERFSLCVKSLQLGNWALRYRSVKSLQLRSEIFSFLHDELDLAPAVVVNLLRLERFRRCVTSLQLRSEIFSLLHGELVLASSAANLGEGRDECIFAIQLSCSPRCVSLAIRLCAWFGLQSRAKRAHQDQSDLEQIGELNQKRRKPADELAWEKSAHQLLQKDLEIVHF